jgi:hypothetical protein
MPTKKSNPQKEGEKPDSGALVRINPADKTLLQDLANQEGESMPKILHRAIELYRRERFLKQVNEGYGRLQSDVDNWKAEGSERQAWVIASEGDSVEM